MFTQNMSTPKILNYKILTFAKKAEIIGEVKKIKKSGENNKIF